ncbi:hypothetical protein LTS18_004486, partial [Coniosporium uncinatum]
MSRAKRAKAHTSSVDAWSGEGRHVAHATYHAARLFETPSLDSRTRDTEGSKRKRRVTIAIDFGNSNTEAAVCLNNDGVFVPFVDWPGQGGSSQVSSMILAHEGKRHWGQEATQILANRSNASTHVFAHEKLLFRKSEVGSKYEGFREQQKLAQEQSGFRDNLEWYIKEVVSTIRTHLPFSKGDISKIDIFYSYPAVFSDAEYTRYGEYMEHVADDLG